LARVNDAARGKWASIIGMTLAVMRNYDSFQSPTHFKLSDLLKRFGSAPPARTTARWPAKSASRTSRSAALLDRAADVILPQRFPNSGLRPDVFSYSGIARLKPGARVLKNWGEDERVRKWLEQLQVKPDLRPLKQDVVGDVGSVLAVIMSALGLVLLLVCANVANLVLVRALARRQVGSGLGQDCA
jgi:hypothetical protein